MYGWLIWPTEKKPANRQTKEDGKLAMSAASAVLKQTKYRSMMHIGGN